MEGYNALNTLSLALMKVVKNPKIPISDWIDAHKLRAKSLLLLGKPKEAIEILEKLCFIIPPIQIPGLKYLKWKTKIWNIYNLEAFDEVKAYEELTSESEMESPAKSIT